MPDVVLTGDRELIRKLNQLDGKAQRRIASKGAREALRPTLAAARANAPAKSGRLRKAVKLRGLKRSRSGRVGARVTTGDKTGDFGGKQFYGAFVELGHKVGRRGRGVRAAESLRRRQIRHAGHLRRRARAQRRAAAALAGDTRPTVEGKRFIRRAADSTKRQAQQIFRRYVGAELIREMKAN